MAWELFFGRLFHFYFHTTFTLLSLSFSKQRTLRMRREFARTSVRVVLSVCNAFPVIRPRRPQQGHSLPGASQRVPVHE